MYNNTFSSTYSYVQTWNIWAYERMYIVHMYILVAYVHYTCLLNCIGDTYCFFCHRNEKPFKINFHASQIFIFTFFAYMYIVHMYIIHNICYLFTHTKANTHFGVRYSCKIEMDVLICANSWIYMLLKVLTESFGFLFWVDFFFAQYVVQLHQVLKSSSFNRTYQNY